AVLAIIGAVFGWLLRTNEDYAGELVDFHQNMGVATAVLAGVTALLLWQKTKNDARSYLPYRTAFALTVICLSIAGHLGANLTHGEDFLTSVLPGKKATYNEGRTS